MPQTTPTHRLPELELLRIHVAHLQVQVAQLQAQLQLAPLTTKCNDLIRHTLLAYVPEEALDQYAVDLEAGCIRLRETPAAEEMPWNSPA